MNHRQEWYELICEYNKYDKARLAKGILERTDCYVGMRDYSEIEECLRQNLFDIVIWVDAPKRHPMEDPSSFNIDKSCADIVVENNDTLEDFFNRVIRIGRLIFKNNK